MKLKKGMTVKAINKGWCDNYPLDLKKIYIIEDVYGPNYVQLKGEKFGTWTKDLKVIKENKSHLPEFL